VAVKNVNEKYRCNICGNEVIVTKAGGGTLVCCGEEMELIEPKKDKKSIIMEEGFEVNEENEGDEPKEIEDYEEDLEQEE
jgi:desulfoferrodoxin-like iron-binding protein